MGFFLLVQQLSGLMTKWGETRKIACFNTEAKSYG